MSPACSPGSARSLLKCPDSDGAIVMDGILDGKRGSRVKGSFVRISFVKYRRLLFFYWFGLLFYFYFVFHFIPSFFAHI